MLDNKFGVELGVPGLLVRSWTSYELNWSWTMSYLYDLNWKLELKWELDES